MLKRGETTRPMTLKKLVYITFKYMLAQNISQLIEDNYVYFKALEKFKNVSDEVVFDEAIRDAFQIMRHWFHYKVPKWLNVINSLQNYVCEQKELKPGNYTYFSTQTKSK